MPYKAIRRDLTEITKKCYFCPKHLTSLKAYILENVDTGEVVFAGPTCAKNNVQDPGLFSNVPDLTKFTEATQNRENGQSEGTNHTGRNIIDDPERKAKEYLLLREYKLAEELNCSYEVLRNYYDKSKIEELSEDDIKHINNIEAKAPKELKLSNLQKVYNYLFWIDVAVNKLPGDKLDFLKGVRSQLMKNKKISEKQKIGVNEWLKRIDGVPQIK